MFMLRRPKGSAKWAGRLLVVGVLAVGPMVLVSSTATAKGCTKVPPTVAGPTDHDCTITGQATVTPGSLSIAASPTIKWAVTLDGFDLNGDGIPDLTAVDATGSGSGWNLTATATPFTDSTGTTKCTAAAPCRMNKPLTVNGSATTPGDPTRPLLSCAASSTCALPTSSVTYPVAIATTCATSGTTCAPTTVASAATGTGMGAIDLATDWWLNIPANAYAGTYHDTITLSIVSGP